MIYSFDYPYGIFKLFFLLSVLLWFTVLITPMVSSSFSLIYFVMLNKLKMFKFQNQNFHPVQICYLIDDSGKFKIAERLSVYSMLLTLVSYYLQSQDGLWDLEFKLYFRVVYNSRVKHVLCNVKKFEMADCLPFL